MNTFIQPAVGIFFLITATVLALLAVKNGRTQDDRWSISARTRFKIAAIFTIVGIVLMGLYLV